MSNEMLISTFNIWLLLLAGCFYMSFPKRGEVTDNDVRLLNWMCALLGTFIAMLLRQRIVSGQVIESFSFASEIYSATDGWIFYIIAIIMFGLFILDFAFYVKQRWDSK